MTAQKRWEERLLEAQHRTIGESLLFFFSGLHLFGCVYFINCWIFLWFHHLNCNQSFLQYYISAASKLNVGGVQDSDKESLRLLDKLPSYSAHVWII